MPKITLPTGRVVPLDQIELEPLSQQFYYAGLNVTAYLSGAQKRTFAGYDVARGNKEASDTARILAGEKPYADGAEFSWFTIAGDTAKGIGADLSTAAQQIRDFAGIGPENAGKRSPLFWLVVLVAAGFVCYQLGIFAWLRKKLSA